MAISGEAGIGKTSLASEAARIVSAKGFRVVWGRCHEGQYVAPYWPWKQIVRELLDVPSRSKAMIVGYVYSGIAFQGLGMPMGLAIGAVFPVLGVFVLFLVRTGSPSAEPAPLHKLSV